MRSTQKIKEIEESLFKLEERLSSFKNYRPQDDFEHRNIKDKKFIQRSIQQVNWWRLLQGNKN